MKTSSAKAKGRKLQQLIAEKIRQLFSLSDKDVKSTTMGESGIDIQLSEEARKAFPWAVEAKSYARIVIYGWWDQCIKAAVKEKLYPVLVVKANHKEPLAIIKLEDFLDLVKNNNKEQ